MFIGQNSCKSISWNPLSRTAQDLTWAEAALLAVLPNRPGLIHPGRQRNTLLAKRNRLLTRLQTSGVLETLDYQSENASYVDQVYIPLDLDGRFSRTVIRAVHRDPHQVLYWHINDTYSGATRHFHDLALYLEPGWHTLIVIDFQGTRITRRFRVLSQSRADAKTSPHASCG